MLLNKTLSERSIKNQMIPNQQSYNSELNSHNVDRYSKSKRNNHELINHFYLMNEKIEMVNCCLNTLNISNQYECCNSNSCGSLLKQF